MRDPFEYLENITFTLNCVIFIMSYFRDKIYLQDVLPLISFNEILPNSKHSIDGKFEKSLVKQEPKNLIKASMANFLRAIRK